MANYYGEWQRGFYNKARIDDSGFATSLPGSDLVASPLLRMEADGLNRFAKITGGEDKRPEGERGDEEYFWTNPVRDPGDASSSASQSAWEMMRLGAPNLTNFWTMPDPSIPLRTTDQHIAYPILGGPGGPADQVYYRYSGQGGNWPVAGHYPQIQWQFNMVLRNISYYWWTSESNPIIPSEMWPEGAIGYEFRGSWADWKEDGFDGDPPRTFISATFEGFTSTKAGDDPGAQVYICKPGRAPLTAYQLDEYDWEYYDPADLTGADFTAGPQDTVELPVDWLNMQVQPVDTPAGTVPWVVAQSEQTNSYNDPHYVSVVIAPRPVVDNNWPGTTGATFDDTLGELQTYKTWGAIDVAASLVVEYYTAPYRYIYATPPPVPPPPTGRVGESRRTFVQP